MRTRDLAYFLKLTQTQSFTQTAAHFKVSQPTITYAIKRLEKTLQTTLIFRDPKHHTIAPTPSGRQFVQHARRMLVELTRAEAEIANAKREKITLGLPPIIGTYYFPRHIPQLTQLGLIAKLETDSSGSKALLAKLLTGKLNLALLATYRPLNLPDLTLIPLAQYPFELISDTASFPLTKGTLSFAQAAKLPFIALDEDFVHNQVFDNFCNAAQTVPKVIYQTTNIDILKTMVSHGAGVALLTNLAITSHDHLNTHPIAYAHQPCFNIYLAYRRDYRLSTDEQKFISVFKTTK